MHPELVLIGFDKTTPRYVHYLPNHNLKYHGYLIRTEPILEQLRMINEYSSLVMIPSFGWLFISPDSVSAQFLPAITPFPEHIGALITTPGLCYFLSHYHDQYDLRFVTYNSRHNITVSHQNLSTGYLQIFNFKVLLTGFLSHL